MLTVSMTDVFNTDRYLVLPALLDADMRRLVYEYTVKKAATITDFRDKQVPGTPAFYGDVVMERLMLRLQPTIERVAGTPVFPTYAYGRVYKHGDVLAPHRDRGACEFTVSVSLGVVPETPWPLWIEGPHGDGVRVDLQAGDAVLFRGTERTHWRDRFEGQLAAQMFLHYVDQAGPHREWKFDKRPAINGVAP